MSQKKAADDNRLQRIKEYKLMYSDEEVEYNNLCELIAHICETPIALVSIVGENTQFFKAKVGLSINETPINQSFCFHVLSLDRVMEIEDARLDPLFKENPLVTGFPNIVFYAGYPISSADGVNLGTLCVIDNKPRKLTDYQSRSLKLLALQVNKLLALRYNDLKLKKLHANLTKEHDRIQFLTESAQVGVWSWNVKKDVILFDRKHLAFAKGNSENMVMKDWESLIHPEDLKLFKDYFQAQLNDNNPLSFCECRMLGKNGDFYWVHLRARIAENNASGKVNVLGGIIMDISERKLASNRWEIISNNIPGAIFRYKLFPDGKDQLLKVSNGAKDLWGYTSDEVMENNQLVWERFHPEDLTPHLLSIQSSKEKLSEWHHVWRYNHPDGSMRWHRGNGKPYKLPDGSVVWDSICLDITDTKENEEKLKQALSSINERVKEQACLNEVIKLCNSKLINEELIQKIVTIIPSGFMYPELTRAAFLSGASLKDTDITTLKPLSRLIEERVDSLGNRFRLEVTISQKMGEIQNAFLPEESKLLESIADNLLLAINAGLSAEKQKEEEDFNLHILENLPNSFLLFKPNGEIILWNRSLVDFTGFGAGDLKNMQVFDFFGKEYRPIIESAIKKVLKTDLVKLELPLIDKNQRKREVLFTAKSILYKGEQCIFGIGVDIEKSKQDFLEISTMVNNTEEAFLWVNNQFEVVSFNRRFKDFILQKIGIHLTKKQKLQDFLQSDQLEKFRAIHSKVLNGETIRRKLEFDDENGYNAFELVFKPTDSIVNEGGDIFILVQDITHSELAKKALLQSKEEILKSEQRFKSLLQGGSDLLAILNPNGEYLYVGPTSTNVLNVEPEFFIGKNAFEFIYEEDRAIVAESFKRLEQEKQVLTPPFRFLAGDGNFRWLESHLSNLLDDENIRGFVANSRDITERVLTSKIIEDSAKRYKALVQGGADLTAIMDAEGNFLYLSPNYPSILGYSEEDLMGTSGFALIHPDELGYLYEAFLSITEKNRVKSKPYRFKHKDGSWVWLQSTGTDMTNEPSIGGIVVNTIEVTEILQIQNELQASNERFELVSKAGSEAIWEYNPQNGNLYMSSGFYRLFGIEPGSIETNNQLFNSHIHPDDLDDFLAAFQQKIYHTNSNTWNYNYRFRKANGQYAHVRDKSLVLRDEDGNAYRIVGAISDISNEYLYSRIDEIEKKILVLGMVMDSTEETVLDKYMRELETLFPKMKASVVRIEDEKLRPISSPSLPKEYIEFLNGQPIGPNQGSCGTAAFIKDSVIAENIHIDENWKDYAYLGDLYGFSACWSSPIFNSDGVVVATLANYFEEPRLPNQEELYTIERTLRLLTIIISRFDFLNDLRKSNERFRLVNETTNDAIYDWDVVADRFQWGEGFRKITGYEATTPFSINDWYQLVYPEDKKELEMPWNAFLLDEKQFNWVVDYRILKEDNQVVYVQEIGKLIRDAKGNPLRMIGVLRDITAVKRLSFQEELRHKIIDSFKGNKKLNESLEDIAKLIIERNEFQYLELWLSSYDSKVLNLVCAKGVEQVADFVEGTRSLKYDFRPGIGLPGQTFESGKILVWENLTSNKNFLRIKEAKKSGIKSAIGIPLIVNNECIGTLILALTKSLKKSDEIVNLYNPLGDYLAGEISRKYKEEQMQLLFSSSPDILGVMSPDTHFNHINPAFAQLMGYSESELLNLSIYDLVHPDDLTKTETTINQLNLDGTYIKNLTHRLLSKSGKYRWISWSSSVAFGEDSLVFVYGKEVSDLIEMEKLLNSAGLLAKVGGWELDLVNDIHHWSDMTKMIHEVPLDFVPTTEQVLGFFPEERKEEVFNLVSEAIENKKAFDFEMPIITKKGNSCWVRCIGNAEYLNDRPVRMVGSLQDINERKRIEQNLEATLEEKNRILESIGDGFIALNHELKITYWNQAAEEVFKKERKDVLGKNIWDVINTTNQNNFKSTIIQAHLNMKPQHELCFLEENEIWLELNVYPGIDSLTVYFKDISEQRKAEMEILRSNERFSKVAEATNDAIWDFNVAENVLFWGKGFEKLFGFDLKEAPNLDKWLSSVHPDDLKELQNKLKLFLSDGGETAWYHEYRFLKKDGSYAWVMDRALAQRDKHGKVYRVLGAMTDISYRKEFEQSLKKLNEELEIRAKELSISNAELEQFAFVASHDLQEPLRMVSSFLTQLEKKYSHLLDDKAHQYIHFAVDGAKRMRQIILDLLEFSRVGRFQTEIENIKPEELVEETLVLMRKQIKDKSAHIHVLPMPEIVIQRMPLSQLFKNLIENALKYSREGVPPEIEIGGECRDGFFHFYVKDNGIGIEAEYFDKIFLIFQRLNPRGNYEGTGMGLAIVKKLVDKLNGFISLKSEVNKGTTFMVSLPVNPIK